MAVVEVREFFKDRRGVVNLTNREYIRTFWVQTDSVNDDSIVARTADDGTRRIPGYGAAYPTDAEAHVEEIEARQVPDTPLLWEVEVKYSTTTLVTGPIEDPLSEPPVVSWATVSYQRAVRTEVFHAPDTYESANWTRYIERTRRGLVSRAIVNTALDPIEGMTIEDTLPSLEITRNEAAGFFSLPPTPGFNWAIKVSHESAINNDEVQILGIRFIPYELLCQSIQATFMRRSGIPYFQVRYVIVIDRVDRLIPDDPRGWLEYVQNTGYRETVYRNAAPLKNQEILDSGGQRVSSPAILKWTGERLIRETEPNEPVPYLRYHVRKEAPFGLLNLPRTLLEIV